MIDADNFIKKHFITKEKTDSAHPPPHPGPHCLKSSQDVPWLGWWGGGGGCNKQDILRQTSELHTAQSEMWQFSLVQRCRPGPGQGALTAPNPTLATLDTGYWELRTNSCQMPNVWVLHSTIVLSAVTGVTYISLGHLLHKPNNPKNTMYYVSLLYWGRFR